MNSGNPSNLNSGVVFNSTGDWELEVGWGEGVVCVGLGVGVDEFLRLFVLLLRRPSINFVSGYSG